ncbi:MAG: glycosyltransferase [Lachnospiraceae bacterium]|nr:glycosyltransferase [Lachnospiraceae bacterium]
MGLQKIYHFLAEENETIKTIYDKVKANNRSHFEKNRCRYWLFLLSLNWQYRILMRNTKSIEISSQNTNAYKLPPVLLEKKDSNKTIEVVSCAFRKHEPQKGLTGGPNGVLATEREVFGDMYHGIYMRYIFHSKEIRYPMHLEKALAGLAHMVRINFYAAYYLENCVDCWSRMSDSTELFFVCHDLGFAYGAYLRGCKYVLIWHTQGSMINERESFGEVLSERDKDLLNYLEQVVFENAEEVYFPSKGAKKAYLDTTQINVENVRFSAEPLYNTISDKKIEPINISKKFHLESIDRANTDIFLSVGDFSENKGLDRIPPILNAYVKATGKNVYWIAIGSRHLAGIYEKLCSEKDNWLFESSLYGERVEHNTLLQLVEYTDYYIMMQRHSIFDLSTLEAMQAGKAIVLSAVGGNLEINRESNVIFVEDNNIEKAIQQLKERDKCELGELNRKVFYQYFSKKSFFKEYAKMIDKAALSYGIVFNRNSEINKRELTPWKNRYYGKKVVICGAGQSLDAYQYNRDYIHIALNRTLFYENIQFDFVFMQDYPRNQPYTMEDYNRYPCTKFYGIITNSGTKNIGLRKEDYHDRDDGNIINYELAPMWYDYRVDSIKFNIDEQCVLDAKSVVFSAIQFAVFAGFREIILYGIDFSDTNYGGEKNPNKYNNAVINNLIAFKKAIKKLDPKILFKFGSTKNDYLLKKFQYIDKNM